MRHVSIDNLSTYYDEHGQPSDDPLVLLHGFTLTDDSWSRQMPAAASKPSDRQPPGVAVALNRRLSAALSRH